MNNLKIELTLENLDQILQTLQTISQQVDKFTKIFNLNQDISDTLENREMLNQSLDSMGSYAIEISHIDSFLQYCDLNPMVLSTEQNRKIISCQELCQILKAESKAIIGLITQIKIKFSNSTANPTISENEYRNSSYVHQELDAIPDTMVNEYDLVKEAIKAVHTNITFVDPGFIFETAGRRLEVLSGSTSLHLETEHEMNVFLDFGIFESRKDGLNVAQRYYRNQFHNTFGMQKVVLSAYNNCRFAILKILKPLPNHGLLVLDESTKEQFIMMDRGLSKSAIYGKRFGILTRYLVLPNFVVTTGAATPIDLDSNSGNYLWSAYEKIMHLNKQSKAYYQGVTNLYKTLIHEDITKTVSSRPLPMNYNALQTVN